MICYECGESAVAVCRWCYVALCRPHLGKSIAERGAVMSCVHRMPAADNSSPTVTETR